MKMETREDKKKVICRICLKYDCENGALSLYEKHNGVHIHEKVKYIANINITEGDNLPENICFTCVKNLDISCHFKQLCERSDTILHSESNITEVPFKLETLDTKYFDVYFENNTSSEFPEQIIENKTEIINDKQTLPQLTKDDSNFECDDCGTIFKSKCKLRVHWKKEHLLDRLLCPYCKLQCKCYKTFNNHIANRKKSCITATKLRIEGVGKSRIFHCKDCNFSSHRLATLSSHILLHTGEKPFICDLCGKGFAQQTTLHSHKEWIHKEYSQEITCDQCGKKVKGRQHWTKHQKLHSKIKFPCSVCNKLYANKDSLKEHMKRHSGVKTYTCEICAKTFCISSDLSNHKTKVHLRKIYSCDKCDYKSSHCSSIASHRYKHTDTNFACNICGKFVMNKDQLALHQKRHFERNFKCLYCDSTFFNKKYLSSHVKRKHNVISVKVEKGQGV